MAPIPLLLPSTSVSVSLSYRRSFLMMIRDWLQWRASFSRFAGRVVPLRFFTNKSVPQENLGSSHSSILQFFSQDPLGLPGGMRKAFPYVHPPKQFAQRLAIASHLVLSLTAPPRREPSQAPFHYRYFSDFFVLIIPTFPFS